MKASSRLFIYLCIAIVVIFLLNIVSCGTLPDQIYQRLIKAPSSLPPSATSRLPSDTIKVYGGQWGNSTCFIGATEGSSRFDTADFADLGINAYHIYGGMSRWEARDDSDVYGYPGIAQIKANPDVINWQRWDAAMGDPSSGSDYGWQPAPRWQGSARTLFTQLQAAHVRIILTLRNRDDQNKPAWSPNPPRSTADWNEWWEHVFALVYWLNVRNNYDVSDFEIHNEPNVAGQGWWPQGDEGQYFTFARYTADAINYVFHTYLAGRSYHIYAPATSGGSWPRDALYTIAQSFDSLDIHAYGNFRASVEQVHSWMKQANHPDEPLWVTEWGSYKHQYNSVPFGVNLITNMIYGSFPGNDYVYGSTIFALYDYSTNALGLIDYQGKRRTDYYAIRMGIRALQGCRPTYRSVSSNTKFVAITTADAQKNFYLLITNQSRDTAYTAYVDLSSLIKQASGIVWRFDSKHLDTMVGGASLKNGRISLFMPASSAVLVKFTPT